MKMTCETGEKMKKENFKFYDAFISYRHTPLDMFVAKTIQKKIR